MLVVGKVIRLRLTGDCRTSDNGARARLSPVSGGVTPRATGDRAFRPDVSRIPDAGRIAPTRAERGALAEPLTRPITTKEVSQR